jgi:hypothetical protein
MRTTLKIRARLHHSNILFCASLLVCAASTATTLAHMSVANMTHASRLILRARCLGNSTRWDAGEIWTFTSFAPVDVWKGSARAPITVRLLGGRAGNITSNVSGIPRFRAGEDVVLFLQQTARGDFSVVSWVQGTFRIGHARGNTTELVTQDSAAFDTFDPSTRQFKPSGIRGLPLNAFRAQVLSALRAETGVTK